MDSLLTLPKGLLAFLLIGGGILLIVLFNPPHSLCDSQVEVVNKNQQKFLFKDPKSKHIKSTRYARLREHCFNTNNPGGCYELFQDLKTMVYDLRNLSGQCAKVIADTAVYKQAIWDSVDLLVMLAWGKSPPAGITTKWGWLEVSDITLYCRLKEIIVSTYGSHAWDSFREKKMRELPGVDGISRASVWELSLLSENCSKYP